MLLVKDLLHLFKGEEWGWRESLSLPDLYAKYKTKMKNVADCLQSFMSGVEASGPSHKSCCSFVTIATIYSWVIELCHQCKRFLVNKRASKLRDGL